MSTSESDSIEAAEEDEEGKLYQWIYELKQINRVETENDPTPQSSEPTSAHLETISEQTTDTGIRRKASLAKGTCLTASSKEVGTDVTENIRELNKDDLKVQPLKEKPWRKSGALISDYFNYGFDEESWRAYCKKQAKLQEFKRKLEAKAWKEKAKYKEGSCCTSSPSGRRFIQAGRESETYRSGGQSRRSIIEKRRPRLIDEATSSQAITKKSHRKDVGFRTRRDLPPPGSRSSFFAFDLLSSPGCRPSSSPATLDSEHHEGFDGRSTSQRRCSSGKERSTATRGAVSDSTKAPEFYERQQKSDGDRDRSRKHNSDRNRKRSRRRTKERTEHTHTRGEEKKDRDSLYKSGRSEEVSRQKRKKDIRERRQEAPQSCSRRQEGRRMKSQTHKKEQREVTDLCRSQREIKTLTNLNKKHQKVN